MDLIRNEERTMKCRLVLDDWRLEGKADSIYSTELGLELSMGDLHSGTTWEGEIKVTPEIEEEIREAMKEHKAYPVFRVLPYCEK